MTEFFFWTASFLDTLNRLFTQKPQIDPRKSPDSCVGLEAFGRCLAEVGVKVSQDLEGLRVDDLVFTTEGCRGLCWRCAGLVCVSLHINWRLTRVWWQKLALKIAAGFVLGLEFGV